MSIKEDEKGNRFRLFKGKEIPSSSSWDAFRCGSCDHIHLIGSNEEGKPIFECVIEAEKLRGMLQWYEETTKEVKNAH